MSEVLQKLVEKLPPEKREKVKRVEGKRSFHGFKMRLKANFEELSLDIDVRYERMTAKAIEEKVEILHLAGDKIVEQKYVGICGSCGKIVPTRKLYVDADGIVHDEREVKHYQKVNGELIEVEPFERTKEMEILKLLPATNLEDFLIESEYEVWGDNIPALWKFAEYLIKNDKIAVAKHSFGKTFIENYALIYPVKRDGKFVLVMALTKMKKQYKHLLPITNKEVKEEFKRKPVSVLPEL